MLFRHKNMTVVSSRNSLYTWYNLYNNLNDVYKHKKIKLYYSGILVVCLGCSLVQWKSMGNILDLSTGVKSVCCCCCSGFEANDGQVKTWHKLLNCLRGKKWHQWPVFGFVCIFWPVLVFWGLWWLVEPLFIKLSIWCWRWFWITWYLCHARGSSLMHPFHCACRPQLTRIISITDI